VGSGGVINFDDDDDDDDDESASSDSNYMVWNKHGVTRCHRPRHERHTSKKEKNLLKKP
jgi:hypothetical protein